jgi:hypothetical protein
MEENVSPQGNRLSIFLQPRFLDRGFEIVVHYLTRIVGTA